MNFQVLDGVISYILYSWHLPLLGAFMRNIVPSLNGLPIYLTWSLFWVWIAGMVVSFSLVIYHLVERPGMRLSDWLRSRVGAQRRQEQAAAVPLY